MNVKPFFGYPKACVRMQEKCVLQSSAEVRDESLPTILMLVLEALAFSLVLNAPFLYEYYRSSGLSPKIFSDWDEPLYLPRAIDAGAIPLGSIFDFSGGLPEAFARLHSLIPHTLLDVIVGNIASFLHLNSIELGLALDLIIAPLSYLLFFFIFRTLGGCRFRSSVATWSLLFLPWIASLSQYFTIPLPMLPHVVTRSHELYPCQPVLRGVYTQVSYPVYAAALLATLLAIQKQSKMRWPVLSGVLSGALVYLYTFGWVACAIVAPLLLLVPCLDSKNIMLSAKAAAVRLLVYFAGWITVSGVGLRAIVRSQIFEQASTAGNAISDHSPVSLPSAYYFSPEMFLLLLVFLFFWSKASGKHRKTTCLLSAVLIAAEFISMNLQLFAGTTIATYHLPVFYLQPVLSGCVVFLLLDLSTNKLIRRLMGCVIVLSTVAISGVKLWQFSRPAKYVQHTIELEQQLQPLTSQEHSAVAMPFSIEAGDAYYNLLPYWISAVTKVKPFWDFVGTSGAGSIAPELAIGWLYTGQIQLIAPCPSDERVKESGTESLTGMLAFERWNRATQCAEATKVKDAYSPCRILRDFKFDLVVYENRYFPSVPEWWKRVLTKLWESEDGEIALFSFSQEKARDLFCPAHVAK